MKLNPEQTKRFNTLIWAFDAATIYMYDKVTDVRQIISIAHRMHLTRIANDLMDIIEFNEV